MPSCGGVGRGALTAAADDDDAGCHGKGMQQDWGGDKGQEATLTIVGEEGDGRKERRKEEAWTGGFKEEQSTWKDTGT